MLGRTTAVLSRLSARNGTRAFSTAARCAPCQNEACAPGEHCKLGWSTTPADKPKAAKPLGSDSANVADIYNKYVMNTYARPPVVFSHGEGPFLFDLSGKKYLDFTAGIAVNALGHSHPRWVKAVTDQAKKLSHTSNLFHTEPVTALAQKLVLGSQFDKAFFSNSGTEANEAALKFARKHARSGGRTDKTRILAFTHGFSGRSMGSLSCTHKAKYRAPYEPLVPGVDFAEFNSIEDAQKMIDDKTCAVIVEPIQGEAGVRSCKPEFIRTLRALCDKHNALLIADEIQCGLGRTGRLWAHEAFGIKPDIMTLAKPLAGGLPIGATLVVEKVSKSFEPGDHGTTFGGGPLACAVAETTFDIISDKTFLASVREKGEYMLHKLKSSSSIKNVKEIRHAGGLFIGLEFNGPVKKIVEDAMHKGVLFVSGGENTLRLCPPLIIEKEQIDQAIKAIEECS